MKLYESYGFNMVSEDTLVSVVRGNTTYIIGQNWVPAVEAPDNHLYKLSKKNWTAKDLVEFIQKFPLERENECTLMFLNESYEDDEALTLVVDEYAVYLDSGIYEIEFVSA